MTAYFISGQAADKRLFENLSLPGISIKHIEWIEPFKNESLGGYAKRLSGQIADPSEAFVLVGVSLGGIAAIELGKIVPAKQVIIISSVATRNELPAHYRLFDRIGLQHLVPGAVYKFYNPMVNRLFGAQSEREKYLLKEYMHAATSNYMKMGD